MPPTHIDPNKRIAIIGAGPAGLSTALFLSRHGFHNVTVLEKLGRVGGLSKSVTIDGMSFDIGANYVTWAYTETLKLANEFGAETYREKPYTTINVQNGKAEYRSLTDAVRVNPYTGKKIPWIPFIFAALKYLWIRWKLSPLINPPDAFSRIDEHPELCVPFKHWLEANGLINLATMFEIPITMMGYGQLADTSAAYALKYMPFKTVFPMLTAPFPIVSLIFPWPRRFTLGFQRLWERVLGN